MKKAMLLLLSAALIASLSACHTAEPATESSAPAPASSEPVSSQSESSGPVSSVLEASTPASEPSGEATASGGASAPESTSSRKEPPASSQAPPPVSSEAEKPASSNVPISEPPPASSEPEPPPAELPPELQPYRRPFDVNQIIADMVQAGEELGMTYDPSLSDSRSSYYPPDDSGNYKSGDEQIFRSNSREGVTFLWRYFQEVEPDTLPEQVHFCPYLEPIGNSEYLIYVFYG